MSELELRGRRAVVTGASRGIGAVVARTLALAGAHVVVGFRSDETGAGRVVAEITGAGGSAVALQANLLQPGEIAAMFETVGRDGPLDVLVHAAAIGSFKPLAEVRANQWDLTLAVNARALVLCAQAAAPLMEGRTGAIVSLSSLGSRHVIPAYGAIGVSKAALEAATRSLAVELASRGIRVNAVAAGLVDTPSIRRHPGFDALRARTLERTPGGRLSTPEEIADVVRFLCGPGAAAITGQTVVADGGCTLTL